MEIDRILAKGVVSDDFLKKEIRSDYLVDEDQKMLWAILLDLYAELNRVCDQYGLRLFADGGTLLGLVRHHGFIPWDDDMDFIMPRYDYEKLCRLAGEFSDPYFLQTPYSDPNYFYSYIKLRNSKTTCLPLAHTAAGYNAGISIDIFPLDVCEEDHYLEERENIFESIMRCSSFMKRNNLNGLSEDQLRNIRKYQTETPLLEYERIQSIASSHNESSSELCGNLVVTLTKPYKNVWRRVWYDSVSEMQFENLFMPAPIGMKARLEKQYGDWMSLPPIGERGICHPNVILDVCKPFTEYI